MQGLWLQYPKKGRGKTISGGSSRNKLMLQFWVGLSQPVTLFKPPLMDHLSCVQALKLGLSVH